MNDPARLGTGRFRDMHPGTHGPYVRSHAIAQPEQISANQPEARLAGAWIKWVVKLSSSGLSAQPQEKNFESARNWAVLLVPFVCPRAAIAP